MRRTCVSLKMELGKKGSNFQKIGRRVIDTRLAPGVANDMVEFTHSYRKHKDDVMNNREIKQTVAPHWSAAKRPTHFLSLRLPKESNMAYITQIIHKHIHDEHREFQPLFIPVERLHLTMGVFTCENEKQLAAATDAVESVLDTVRPDPFQLFLKGLGTFGNGRVVVAKVTADDDAARLDTVVRRMRATMSENGVDIKGNPFDRYVPHVTVAKVRPQHRESLGVKVVPTNIYHKFLEETFGAHEFAQVDVCAMQGKSDDGYYPIVKSFKL